MPALKVQTAGGVTVIRPIAATILMALVGGCADIGVDPICAMTGDVMSKARMGCRLSAEDKRAFDAEISRRQSEAAAYQEAQWLASNPGKCPRRLTQPYDYDLARQYDDFMQQAQFTLVSDGYGRGVTRVYVPSASGDAMLIRMREGMAKRDEMCRKSGYQPAGFVPPIFGQGV